MSVERAGGAWIVSCDQCGTYEEAEGTFQDAIDQVKQLGWRIEPDASGENGWAHVCPGHEVDEW